jgi:hypothetical protein
MGFPSWSRNRKEFHAGARVLTPRSPRRRVRFRPRTEALDERCLLRFGNPISTAVSQLASGRRLEAYARAWLFERMHPDGR